MTMARKTIEPNISYDQERRLYYLTVDLGRDEQGRRKRISRTFSTLTAARAARREHLLGQDRQKAAPTGGSTLGEWLDCWMDTIVRPNRAQTTVYAYEKIIKNHVAPLLGAVPLEQLSPWDIQQYYIRVQRKAGLSTNTVRRHHDMLAAALRAAVRRGGLPISPMEQVEPPRVVPRETSFYGLEDLRQLYRLVEGLPRITLHGLRHSFATIACLQGASLFDIGKALGHSTPSTTGRIYTHLVDRTHESTVQRVSAALK